MTLKRSRGADTTLSATYDTDAATPRGDVPGGAAAAEVSRLAPAQPKRCRKSPPRAVEVGDGSIRNPHSLPLAAAPNRSGCVHCPLPSCSCLMMGEVLKAMYGLLRTKRITEVAGRRELCAKSLLPTFVSRVTRILHVTPKDTFYDLGCGNGSVLFQVAFLTGAPCVGVELSAHNAQVARDAWEVLRGPLEKAAGRPMPPVTIITGDIGEVIAPDDFFSDSPVILTSNLLFPKSLTHFMSERFRRLPVGSRVLCFDDLYPHGRSVAALRDPDAFAKFRMTDYRWQERSVEWCNMEGPFFVHERK